MDHVEDGASITGNKLEGLGDVASELVSVWDLDVGHDGSEDKGESGRRILYERGTVAKMQTGTTGADSRAIRDVPAAKAASRAAELLIGGLDTTSEAPLHHRTLTRRGYHSPRLIPNALEA